MKRFGRVFATCVELLLGLVFADAALAQKQGGVLRVFHRDSPPACPSSIAESFPPPFVFPRAHQAVLAAPDLDQFRI